MTPHLSAEIVAPAGTNKVVIEMVIVGEGPGHSVSTGVSFNHRRNPSGSTPTASEALGGIGGIDGVSAMVNESKWWTNDNFRLARESGRITAKLTCRGSW